MDHIEAIRLDAVDRYLLNDLEPDLRDAFEEHFFDCQECAAELRATSAFMEAAKKELKSQGQSKVIPVRKSRLQVLQAPVVLLAALAACLVVMVYQNVFFYPKMERTVAELRMPEILHAVSLVGGTSRGGGAAEIEVRNQQPFLLNVDIPTNDQYTSYTCSLIAPGGEVLWRIDVSSQAARDTVTIGSPAGTNQSGTYTLVVKGNQGSDKSGPEVVRRNFNLIIQR